MNQVDTLEVLDRSEIIIEPDEIEIVDDQVDTMNAIVGGIETIVKPEESVDVNNIETVEDTIIDN